MHINHKVLFAVAVLSTVAIASILLASSHALAHECQALCLYRTEIGSGRVSIWLAWEGSRLKDTQVMVQVYGRTAIATTNSSGALSILVGPGFSGGSVTIYYKGYYAKDSIYSYPYAQDLVYIAIGLLIYAAMKKFSDIGASHKKVHLMFGNSTGSIPEVHNVSINDLSKAIAEVNAESSEAIRYKGAVASAEKVCLKIARMKQFGRGRSLLLPEEIDSLLHFEGYGLGLRVVNGTIYGSADAVTDLCARHLYNSALFNGSYSLPKKITSYSIIKRNHVEIANGLKFGIMVHRYLHSKRSPAILAFGLRARINILSKACLPSRRASAFMLAYISGAIGVSYA